MINLAAVSSASGAGEYYSRDNYYTSSELTEASQWVGLGADMLGLDGRVEEQAFIAVLSGDLPDGSAIRAVHGQHRPGLDMTFSAPKSVSLLALLGRDDRVLGAFRVSVNATLGWAEKNLIEGRVWDPQARSQNVERTGTRNPGGKTSAIETTRAPSNEKSELPVPVLEIERRFDLGL